MLRTLLGSLWALFSSFSLRTAADVLESADSDLGKTIDPNG
jgi:hypothetical protein